jgi:hypothetical protein
MKYNFKLIIGIILTILILACSTVVFADNSTVIITPGGTQNETVQNTEVINTETQNSATQGTIFYNNVNTTQNTETLPKTGVTDGYVVAILVTVCAISAVYAYRKVRDFNIK